MSCFLLQRESRRGFTLVELLIVIAIIGILVSLLLPAVNAARSSVRNVQCQNNLKQIGIALTAYHAQIKFYPFGSYDHDYEGSPAVARSVRYGGTWRTFILPWLDQDPLWQQIAPTTGIPDSNYQANHPYNQLAAQEVVVPTYICPDEPTPHVRGGWKYWSFAQNRNAAVASYMGNAGPVSTGPLDWGFDKACGLCTGSGQIDRYCDCTLGNKSPYNRGFYHGHNPGGPGMLDMYPNAYTSAAVRDGASNTIFVGETHGVNSNGDGCGDHMNWMSTWCVATTAYGINASNVGSTWQDGCNFRSYHQSGANFVFVDGSVKFLNETINLRTFGWLGNRKDGQSPTGY